MSFVEPTNGQRGLKDGQSPSKITLSGTVNVGDPVAYNSGWKQADATNSSYEPVLIAGESGASGDIIVAYQTALVDFGPGSTATTGGLLYLSDTAGDYSASTGTTKYIIGRQTTAREAYVWGIREVSLDMMEDNSIDSDQYVDGSIDEVHMSANSIDSDSYVDNSIDKAHLATEVYTIEHVTFSGEGVDAQTIKLTQVLSACTVVRIAYFTDQALGSSVGIDVIDGGANGSGTDVINSCSDNLNGSDVNDVSPYVLSAGDYINITIDDITNSTFVTVDIQLKVPLSTAT